MRFEKSQRLLRGQVKENIVYCTGAFTEDDDPIWEADIIENKNGGRFKIIWDPFRCGFSAWSDKVGAFDIFELEKKSGPVRVIGNIYENPELLK